MLSIVLLRRHVIAATWAAWRFLYEAIMPKWFACLVESIGVAFIILAVLMALLTFFVERCS